MKKFTTRTALAVVAVFALLGGTALATHTFPDVDHGRFYSDPVDWAVANSITSGCQGGTNFCPDDPVTRGENITFAYRYDQNVVQPALASIPRVNYATVLATGTVRVATPGVNVASSGQIGTGTYEVFFTQPVTSCSAQVTAGTADGFGSGALNASTEQRAGSGGLGIFVVLTDLGGSRADGDFMLQVTCHPGASLLAAPLSAGSSNQP